MAANVWDNSTVDGKWSTDANWSLGHVPTATETATFDATSNTNCTIDAGVVSVLGVSMTAAYTSTITQAVDLTIGTGGFAQAAGTFQGLAAKWCICAGNWTKTGGTGFTTGVGRVQMTGTDTTMVSNTSLFLHTLRISAAVVFVSDVTVSKSFIIDPGAVCYVPAGETVGVTWDTAGYTFDNAGMVCGTGNFDITPYQGSKTINPGIIQCGFRVLGNAGAGASYTITLSGPLLGGGAAVVSSAHAANTMTLNLNGHRLECASLTVGTRGNVTGTGDSSVFCAGRLTQSDATPTTICNGGFPFWASGGVTGMGAQSNYVGNGRSMCRMMARNMPKRLSQKWGVG